jgi:Zn-dependent M28 family amino/carboxypeptidase
MRRPFLLFPAAFLLALTTPAQQSATHFDGASWWSHVKVLADDNMEGRDTGSEGLRKAEAYVVDQLKKDNLTPAGTDGFYQPVKFIKRQIDEKNSYATLVANGQEQPLALGDDAFFGTGVDIPTSEVTAQLVFAGYGIQVPETHYDDLVGLDLKGKIVVYISGSPADVPNGLSAHYQTNAERWKALKTAGAIGTIRIFNPAAMDLPWARFALNRTHPTMDLADAEFHETNGMKIGLAFNPSNAEKLFAGSGHTFAEIAALAKDRKPMPHFPLAFSLKAKPAIEITTLDSANIVAKLPGTDPALKNEYVVLSAHIDHVGIGEPINGDRIYNGAMDNASGSALLLDMAAELKAHPEKLRRSVLFVFVTAEEKGLLGSKYFAAHPTVDAHSMIANINTDMFLPIIPLRVLVIEGLAESDLGDRAATVAQSLGVKPIPDPTPLRNYFIRSDQYNFVRHGIPAIAMSVSADPGTPQQQTIETWLANRYHAPSDDTNQPIDLKSAALFEEIVRQLLITTANTDAKPQWKPDSFFRRFATASGSL